MDYEKNKEFYENQIYNFARENKILREKNQELEISFLNLENQYSNLKTVYSLISSKESQFILLEKAIMEKDKEILTLKEEIIKLKSEFEKIKSEYDLKYEKEIKQMKYFNENNINKIENSNRLEKLNKILYYRILNLEENKKEKELEIKNKLLEKEFKCEKKITELKQKVIEKLKEEGKKAKDFSLIQKNLNYKLNNIYNKELINELEYQSFQIEDLLKQREHLDKIINGYKSDIKVHENVEKSLTKKNKKYSEIIKVLSNKIDSFNSVNLINSQSCDRIFNMKKNSNKKNIITLKKCDNNSIILNKEIIINKNKEIQTLKSKNEQLKSKLEFIHFKFSNILELFDNAFEKITNDENFKINNELFIKIEDLKKYDFEKLNNEQKYSLLILIIKYILPFINNEGLTSNLINKTNNIQTIFYYCQNNSESTFTPSNTKTIYNNSKDFMKKRICLMKDINKIGFNKSKSNFLNNSNENPYFFSNYSLRESNPLLKKSYSLLKL